MLPRVIAVLLLLGARIPAQLLALDIAALDNRGALISDLQASDFRITDAARPQQIAYFRRGPDETPPEATQRFPMPS